MQPGIQLNSEFCILLCFSRLCRSPRSMTSDYFLGVDVGTGSVRAALVTPSGSIIATSTHEIKTWNPLPDFYEQSSEDIWSSCCKCVKDVINKANVSKDNVKGIGFDATCSL